MVYTEPRIKAAFHVMGCYADNKLTLRLTVFITFLCVGELLQE